MWAGAAALATILVVKAHASSELELVGIFEQEERIKFNELDPVNYEYPYNLMSADWGNDDAPIFYDIPEWCKEKGGCFPEVVQAYTYCQCRQNGISYELVLALIEHESQYRYDAIGDEGHSKGYMQIYEDWHLERMENFSCEDLFNPYQNIRVGVDFLKELTDQFGDERLVLMCYNRGERNEYGTGAVDLWEEGIYETEYSRTILERKAEIEGELEGN